MANTTTGTTLDIENLLSEDTLATAIANKWLTWDTLRNRRKNEWQEVRNYVYATDTTSTSNSTLPWKNTTTTPKLCQIRDNLFANYMAALLPKKRFIDWEADQESDEQQAKREAIRDYTFWSVERGNFKNELRKLLYDWVDYGDCFATIDWDDERVENGDRISTGYIGPVIRRISPYDIVFDPKAESFAKTPKILREIVQFGEIEKELSKLSNTEENIESAQALLHYMREIRGTQDGKAGDLTEKDVMYSIDGFTSYRDYLNSGYVEVLTFRGDLYDVTNNELYENYVIKVVDRHKILYKAPEESVFGYAPIFKAGWRIRGDNLWSMGPLENLVGLQYRIDHIENTKADFMDLTIHPPLKIRGYVEDFEWGPMERIFVGDDGEVEVMEIQTKVLEANVEIQRIIELMEEMAGAPKEAMGFRTPGEKTMYEVQRLENAASRIFQSKIIQFEEEMIEKLLNGMLELARRKMPETTIRVFKEEDGIPRTVFESLTAEDISGVGRIRPMGARHFAEKAELVQNLNNFFSSAMGADEALKIHFSSVGLAKMMEDILDIKDYKVVLPYIRMSEQSDAQKLGMAQEEENAMTAMTPAGIDEDDFDDDAI